MDNYDVYNAAKEKAFNKIKHIRNSFAARPEELDPTMKAARDSLVFDVGGEDYSHYSFIVETAKSYSHRMFSEIIVNLLKRYGIDYALVDFSEFGITPLPILAFIHKTPNGNNLFIFREYGLSHRISDSFLSAFATQNNWKYIYVSLVEKNAFSEVLNHNDNENDPTRGTGTVSLPFFLQVMFGSDERIAFIEFATQYTKEVREYLGLSVTRTLTPNAHFSFRRSAEYELRHFDYLGNYQMLVETDVYKKTLDEVRKEDEKKKNNNPRYKGKSLAPISDTQWKKLYENVVEKAYYKVLLGKCDFAQSYLTAEWLFDSMSAAGRIDYSPVAMGYFKSVEQLIWRILALHKNENLSIKEKGSQVYLSINSPQIVWDNNGFADNLDTTIGALIGAIDFYRNRQLIFRGTIDECTRDAIVIMLNVFKHLRNGYTHKDNITDWEFIIFVRNVACVVYYLLLGSCTISANDVIRLGATAEGSRASYLGLCDYINYHANQPYYLYDAEGNCRVAIGKPDDEIEFDEYGIPTFSGAHFQLLPNATSQDFTVSIKELMSGRKTHKAVPGEMFTLDENSMPDKIYKGISYLVAEGMWYSGPQQLIFDNGVFIDPGLTEKPKY